MIYNSV